MMCQNIWLVKQKMAVINKNFVVRVKWKVVRLFLHNYKTKTVGLRIKRRSQIFYQRTARRFVLIMNNTTTFSPVVGFKTYKTTNNVTTKTKSSFQRNPIYFKSVVGGSRARLLLSQHANTDLRSRAVNDLNASKFSRSNLPRVRFVM